MYLITLLANQPILIHNLRNKGNEKDLLTEDEVELLTTPNDLGNFKDAITEALLKGTKETLRVKIHQKRTGRVSDEELFTRLLYYGIVHLHLTQEEVWMMPLVFTRPMGMSQTIYRFL